MKGFSYGSLSYDASVAHSLGALGGPTRAAVVLASLSRPNDEARPFRGAGARRLRAARLRCRRAAGEPRRARRGARHVAAGLRARAARRAVGADGVRAGALPQPPVDREPGWRR